MNYVLRLVDSGMRFEDAVIVVNDFTRELDWVGLEDYVAMFERVHSGVLNV